MQHEIAQHEATPITTPETTATTQPEITPITTRIAQEIIITAHLHEAAAQEAKAFLHQDPTAHRVLRVAEDLEVHLAAVAEDPAVVAEEDN